MTFAAWLLAQQHRTDWIGDLARAARNDPQFPRQAAPLAIYDRVRAHLGDDAQMLHALHAALNEWHGEPYPLARDQQERAEEKRKAAMREADVYWAAEAKKEAARRKAARDAKRSA